MTWMPTGFARCVIAVVLLASGAGCVGRDANPEEEPVPQRTLTEVQDAHTDAIMAVPGVVGIYQGAVPDGRPCLKVMVLRDSPEIRNALPDRLEGYPVLIEVTGEIRPLDEDRDS